MQPTPKINRRLVKRTVGFVIGILVLAYGFYWLVSKHGDPDQLYAPSPTFGDIAAVEAKGDGAQAVIIHPDGKIIAAPDYKAGAYDQNVTWRADGGRLFFESDRENAEPHLYRWNTEKGILERRTTDKRPKGFLSFTVPGDKQAASEAGPTALMISGGTILQIDANSGETKQLLPPYNKNSSQGSASSEEGGQNGMAAYATYGNSFVKALWTKDRHYIIAVLNRESGDQSLIIQDMTQPKAPPIPIAQAKHIGVDVGQVSGVVVYSLLGAEIPDWIPEDQKNKFKTNGKIVPPYAHELCMFMIDDKKGGVIAASKNDAVAFGDPVISPDETLIALPIGPYVSGALKPVQIIAIPPKENGSSSAIRIAPGDFSRLSWAPDGSKIVALMKAANGSKDVVTVDPVANGQVDNLTQGQGSFLEAVISPQAKASTAGS
jgi:WD40-like Beta Propeller Repeat